MLFLRNSTFLQVQLHSALLRFSLLFLTLKSSGISLNKSSRFKQYIWCCELVFTTVMVFCLKKTHTKQDKKPTTKKEQNMQLCCSQPKQMSSCRRTTCKLAITLPFFFLSFLVSIIFALPIHFPYVPLKFACFSGDTTAWSHFIVWKLTNRGIYTAAQERPCVFFFKIWKIAQHQKDNGKARTIRPSVSALLWGSITACIIELLWKFTEAKNKAINDFNRSMRKSFFPNEGCCLNPGRSNLNWTKEQTKEDLETCGRTNAWLRIVQWFKLTTLNPKLSLNYFIWSARQWATTTISRVTTTLWDTLYTDTSH